MTERLTIAFPADAAFVKKKAEKGRDLVANAVRGMTGQPLTLVFELSDAVARKLVEVIAMVRELDLKKPPSIAESIDWARALLLLGADDIDGRTFTETMSIIVKHRTDLDVVAERVGVKLPHDGDALVLHAEACVYRVPPAAHVGRTPGAGAYLVNAHGQRHAGVGSADGDGADQRVARVQFRIARLELAAVGAVGRGRFEVPARVERAVYDRIAWHDVEHGRDVGREVAVQRATFRFEEVGGHVSGPRKLKGIRHYSTGPFPATIRHRG